MNNFIPKKKKFKKYQKGKNFNKIVAVNGLDFIKFGFLGLKALKASRLNSKQLSSLVKTIKKLIKKSGKLTLKVFPHNPISKKPIEVRMGKGKGNVSHWVANVKVGMVICEIESKYPQIAIKALNTARVKLPFKTKIFI